ncbi:MAG: hypothetical protein Kow0063_42220 [Anaerolineae bacterium]
MILLPAIVAGLLAGFTRARRRNGHLKSPDLRLVWLVPIAFLPQWLAFDLEVTRRLTTDTLAATALVGSQVLLLGFAWFNRNQPGFWALGTGLILNLAVIACNGGLMPVSPDVVTQLLSDTPAGTWRVGERVGWNVILPVADTSLWWLSDHLLLPAWFPYRNALSIGDILIAVGAFWYMWALGSPEEKA